ncbi:hypothetical protein GGR92_005008 [Spirosoma lacussanchae]|uniref:hypothetical protein n=1 Tax=Spirosoma lacussanchae TaxID=1884249 RepID=UPI001FE78A59|nr:hypothetical protein [Spirosoma lacussanchae]
MIDCEPHFVWSPAARLTFERMPADVQAALLKELPRMAERYRPIYHHSRPAHLNSVGTVSHFKLPDWNIWLRMDTGYLEDEGEPVLFINELDELTQAEVEASVAAARANPNRINQ